MLRNRRLAQMLAQPEKIVDRTLQTADLRRRGVVGFQPRWQGTCNIVGSFITNLHVRDAGHDTVIEALRSIDAVPAYVRGAREATWTSIFPEAADQDEVALSDMARDLSKVLKRPVIAFIVHDSDILLYWLFDGGKQLDHYNSAPGYFTDEISPPVGGNPETLTVVCPTGVSTDQLSRLLHPERHAPEQPAKGQSDPILDALRKKLRQSYPKLAASMPDPPSLDEFLAQAEKRLAARRPSLEGAPSAIKEFVFAEDRLVELATLLGIPDGPVIDSYRYLANGEGSPGALTLVHAEGESSISLE